MLLKALMLMHTLISRIPTRTWRLFYHMTIPRCTYPFPLVTTSQFTTSNLDFLWPKVPVDSLCPLSEKWNINFQPSLAWVWTPSQPQFAFSWTSRRLCSSCSCRFISIIAWNPNNVGNPSIADITNRSCIGTVNHLVLLPTASKAKRLVDMRAWWSPSKPARY